MAIPTIEGYQASAAEYVSAISGAYFEFSVDRPAVTEGQLLVMFFTYVSDPSDLDFSVPGFTTVANYPVAKGIYCGWKVAGASEPSSYTVSVDITGSVYATDDIEYQAVVIVIDNFNKDEPIPPITSGTPWGFGNGFGWDTGNGVKTLLATQALGSPYGADALSIICVSSYKVFPVAANRGAWTTISPLFPFTELYEEFRNVATEDSANQDRIMEVHYGNGFIDDEVAPQAYGVTYDSALAGVSTPKEFSFWCAILIAPPTAKYGWGIVV